MARCMTCSFRAHETCAVGHNLQKHCDDFGDGTKLLCTHHLLMNNNYGIHINESGWSNMRHRAQGCKCNAKTE